MRFACALMLAATAVHAQIPEVAGDPVTQASMRYIDVVAGTGDAAAPGKQFTVHYTGWLRDGKKFDSSVDRNEPFVFVQGRRQVIAGWDVGFEGMKTGGKRRLLIPYQFAYGETGRGPIPPKAELIFDVELLKVSDPPNIPAAADVLSPFTESENKILALAKAVPEEKYAWRPAPGVRSFGEVLLHIAYGNQLLLNAASGAKLPALNEQIERNAKGEKQTTSKDAIVTLLTETFAATRKAFEEARPAALGRDTEFFGRPSTLRGIYVVIDTHMAEHLGQAIAYARMAGVVPPWSR